MARPAAAECRISATFPVSFPSYHGLMGTVDALGTLVMTCSEPVTGITVALSSSAAGPRRMQGAEAALLYDIYLDEGRTVVWGDGAFGTEALGPFNHPGGTMTLVLYARIFPGQSVPAGSYGDALQILASF
jgi:spore coat protein U-like protein